MLSFPLRSRSLRSALLCSRSSLPASRPRLSLSLALGLAACDDASAPAERPSGWLADVVSDPATRDDVAVDAGLDDARAPLSDAFASDASSHDASGPLAVPASPYGDHPDWPPASVPEVDVDWGAGTCSYLLRDERATATCTSEAWCVAWLDAYDVPSRITLTVPNADARACIVILAKQRGIHATSSDSGEYVEFVASYAQAGPLVALDAVTYISLGCPAAGDKADCSHCEALDLTACRADAYCAVFQGARLNEEAHCYDVVDVGCRPAPLFCSLSTIYQRSPEGDCYYFPSTCHYPRDFVETADPVCREFATTECK